MRKYKRITPEFARKIFDYEGGNLIWKERLRSDFSSDAAHKIWNRKFPGKVAGYKSTDGYRHVRVDRENYICHRIIWVYHFGEIPEGMQIDHINHHRDDNRIRNLRLVTIRENQMNTKPRKNTTSGHIGVCKFEWGWVARIHHKGKSVHLGMFKDKADAIKARREAEEKFGFHQNHGL
ncbi:TPA: HNH endonuclease signature motif containing protein [Serratia marcescens]